MSDTHPSPIQQPSNTNKPTSESKARIFTMPERYRHGAQVQIHEPEKKQTLQPRIEIKTPIPPAPEAPATSPKIPHVKKRSTTKFILIAGFVTIVLLAIGGFFVIQRAQKTTQTTITTTPPAPSPVVAPVVTQEPEKELEDETGKSEEPFPASISSGTDTDSDGLTDTEEELVYKTNARLPDTDEDGFLDGNEVYHGYNPAGVAPGTLLEAHLVEVKQGNLGEGYEGGVTWQFEYTFYYPGVWTLEEKTEETILDTLTGEGLRISFEKKDVSAALAVWMQSRKETEGYALRINKKGLNFAQSQDQLTTYINVGNAIMIIAYDTGIKSRIEYLQTVQMMINSVSFTTIMQEAAQDNL